MGYKYQFPHTPYVLRAKVTRAGPFPPTIATLGASIVRCYCGYGCGCGCGCGCYCGYCCLRLRCGGRLQRDSCRLVAVKVGVAVVVCSATAVDWLR